MDPVDEYLSKSRQYQSNLDDHHSYLSDILNKYNISVAEDRFRDGPSFEPASDISRLLSKYSSGAESRVRGSEIDVDEIISRLRTKEIVNSVRQKVVTVKADSDFEPGLVACDHTKIPSIEKEVRVDQLTDKQEERQERMNLLKSKARARFQELLEKSSNYKRPSDKDREDAKLKDKDESLEIDHELSDTPLDFSQMTELATNEESLHEDSNEGNLVPKETLASFNEALNELKRIEDRVFERPSPDCHQ